MVRHRRNVRILLLEDNESLGQVGDVVDVRPGYARNFLFPRGEACPVTPDALARVEREKKRAAVQRAERARRLGELQTALEGLSLTIEERASEEGHLFGSVGAMAIHEAMEVAGVSIEEKMIRLEAPIKELGIYSVPVRLDAEHETSVRVWIVEPTETAA